MIVFPRLWYPLKPLDHLPPDQMQAWVNDIYIGPLHRLVWNMDDPPRSYVMREIYFPGLGTRMRQRQEPGEGHEALAVRLDNVLRCDGRCRQQGEGHFFSGS